MLLGKTHAFVGVFSYIYIELRKLLLIKKYYSTCRPASNFSIFFLDKGKATTIMAEIYVESFGNIEEANMVGKLNVLSLISVPICIYAVFTNAILLFRFWHCFDDCSPYFAIFALPSVFLFFYF